MITLTKRQKDISLYLLKQNDYLTGRQLAEHFFRQHPYDPQ